MYPEELERFIRERNYKIGGEDLLKVISTKENTQLIRVTLYPGDNCYELKDKFGNHYAFKALPYDESEEQKRVRKRTN